MTTVRAHQLASLAGEAVAAGVKVLSLDCFDTLLWRTTHQPADVFSAEPMMLRRTARIHIESEARQRRRVLDGRTEVHIDAIYEHAFSTPEQRAAAVEAEMAAERAHCFAFAPAIHLVRAARNAGLRVVVVSDTYFAEPQLRKLITVAAGADVAEAIERIYCSCEHGVSKAGGLLSKVLKDLKVSASQVLHVGDNRLADFESAQRAGMHARHFEQFDDLTEQQLRLEAAALALLDPSARASRPVYQPQRATLSRGMPLVSDPGERLGYSCLGPILYGFASWVQEQAKQWRVDSRQPKLLFLMRDGFLPQQVYQLLFRHADAAAHAIEISRFTAFGASFRAIADIDAYLTQNLHSERYEAIARQLHFTAAEAAALDRTVRRAADPQRAFADAVRGGRNKKLILERAKHFRSRLVAHLRRSAGLEPSDRIMIIDLGYAGTVQDRIEPFLREEMGLDVLGCYALLRDLPDRYNSKRGFISAEWIDARAIDSLCDFIALFEQLCAIEQGSVVDYTDAGEPIRRNSGLASHQSTVRNAAQRGCLRFVTEVVGEPPTGSRSVSTQVLRQVGAAVLARLLFFPSAEELELFKGFEHDVNMGVDDKVLLFDPDACRQGLRDRGLFYVNDNPRQFLPAELRANGLPLTLTLLAQRRFGLDLRPQDFGIDRITLPIMVADQTRSALAEVEAHPTHDGYFLARIPLGHCQYSIAVLFGRQFERLQLATANVTRQDLVFSRGDLGEANDVLPEAVHEDTHVENGDLLQPKSEAAFTFFHPPALDTRHRYVLNVAFRPLQRRKKAVHFQTAATC